MMTLHVYFEGLKPNLGQAAQAGDARQRDQAAPERVQLRLRGRQLWRRPMRGRHQQHRILAQQRIHCLADLCSQRVCPAHLQARSQQLSQIIKSPKFPCFIDRDCPQVKAHVPLR